MVGDVLRGFKRALVLQVRGDAGRPEGMVPDPRLNASAARPPLDHAVGVLLPHGLAGERAGLADRRTGTKARPDLPRCRRRRRCIHRGTAPDCGDKEPNAPYHLFRAGGPILGVPARNSHALSSGARR